jgi:4-amino-4-deoxy-L-arabinose transferase-like glycosyltransferase
MKEGTDSAGDRANPFVISIVCQRDRLLYLFLTAFMLQATVSVIAYLLYDVPVSTEVDSVEYIRTADNVLAGNGFSIEDVPPWGPNAFRTPGPLLINVPLRILTFESDLLAIIISRLVLLGAALSVIDLALRLGLSSFALLAGTFFVLMPSIAYYSLLPYSTETPYVAACGLLFVGSLAFLTTGKWGSLLLIGLAAMYALYLRPAALFVLGAYIVVAMLIALRTRYQARRRTFLAAASCLLGVIVAFGTWGYRNYKIFGAFQYSTVSGYNLLHHNARGMEFYLDETGKQELRAASEKYRTYLPRYSGLDQFVISNAQAEVGLGLIFKYPLAFLQSHLEGVIQSFFVFSPNILKSRSPILVIAASIVHSGLAVMGILGLVGFWKTFSETQKLALLLMLTVGVVSTLTGGALFSPRFRSPLDLLLAVGCALFVMRALRRNNAQVILKS